MHVLSDMYSSTAHLRGAALVGALALGACGGDLVGPAVLLRAPPEIRAFVLGQNLVQIRGYEGLLSDPAHDFVAFRVTYGPPQDCPSGCFYVGGWGIKYHQKVGWVGIDLSAPFSAPPSPLDPGPGDDYLFGADVQERLRTLGIMELKQYRVLLVRDADTPEPALYDLAQVLPVDGDVFLGMLLTENARVRSSRRILTVLAGVSGGGYDWRAVNARAAELLVQLP